MVTVRTVFTWLLLFTAIVVVVFTVHLHHWTLIKVVTWKGVNTWFRGQSLLSTNRSDDRLFDNFTMDYQQTLSKVAVPQYKNSSAFVDIGPPVGNISRKNDSGSASKQTKLILTWTKFYGLVKWMPTNVTCETKNVSCIVTTDRSDLMKSDAVVFHPIDLRSYPQQRLPHQRWIYLSLEPPYLVRALGRRPIGHYNGKFNWTSTYRWDSDIPNLYYNATLLKQPLTETQFLDTVSNITKTKHKLLAIMNSNCNPRSPRFKILAEIRKYLPVDFYGKCGNLTCPRGTEACKEKMSSYKFYLSFENSECRDYVTEKVLYPLQQWKSVPIVFGAPPHDYNKIMPPNSYIDVKGFSSIQRLAEYIKLLDRQPALYNKYHEWRRNYYTKFPWTRHPDMCTLCEALFDPSLPVKQYRDMKGWYEQDTCK